MCGIVSFSGFKDKLAPQMNLKFLLLFNDIRGQDAMGFYSLETGVIKKKGKPKDLFSEKEFTIPKTNQFLGHVRSSTSGGNTDDSAHPFQRGNIVLVMNGTLILPWKTCTDFGVDHTKIHVDSDGLCAMLEKTQSKEPLTKIDGACACVWIDTTTKKMYAYRNADRPLFRGIIEEEGMYISSTKESLEAISCVKIEEFKQDNLYEIVDGKILLTVKVKRYIKPESNTKQSWSKVTDTIYHDFEAGYAYKELDLTFNTKEKLVGKYLIPKEDFFIDGINFSKNKRYLVVEPRVTLNWSDLAIYHPEKDMIIHVGMFRFSNKEPIVEKGSFLFAVKHVKYQSDGALFCSKGDLVQVDKITTTWRKGESEDAVTVSCLDNENSVVLYKDTIELFRVALRDEISEYWNNYKYPDNKETANFVILSKKDQFKKDLESIMSESYEDLCEYCLENLEDCVNDADALTKKEKYWERDNMKELIEKMQIVIQYFRESAVCFPVEDEKIEK